MSNLWFEITFWLGQHRRAAALAAIVLIAGVAAVAFTVVHGSGSSGIAFTGSDGNAAEPLEAVAVTEDQGIYNVRWGGTWGAASARGVGTLLSPPKCNLSCTNPEQKVKVVATQLKECNGSTQYGKLIVIVPSKHKAKKITVPNSDPSCKI